MRITIHQPEHLPWLGLLHKMQDVDVFVVLDNVQYRRRYFQNRNKLRSGPGEGGVQWITVPVRGGKRDETLIKDVRTDTTGKAWQRKNLASVRKCYGKAPYFDAYFPGFEAIYSRETSWLGELNTDLLRWLMQGFGIDVPFVWASELPVRGTASDLILSICEATGATSYFSGISGNDYLNMTSFARSGIEVGFQEFHHPIYEQLHQPFIPCISSLELLFLYGPGARAILNGEGVEQMDTLFL